MTNRTAASGATEAPRPPTPSNPIIVPDEPKLITLADIDLSPAPPKLLDLLDPIGHTILYGTGGVGKGTIAADIIGRLVTEGHRVAIVDFEQNEKEWARRIDGLGYKTLLNQVMYLAPNHPDWAGTGGPMETSAPEIRQRLDRFDAQIVVIDSLGFAVNGDPSSAETANAFNRAIANLERPAVSLGHVAREANMQYPFGSVFWHNGARVTWSIEAKPHGIVMSNRKHNNYARAGDMVVIVTWADDIDPKYGTPRHGIPLKVEYQYLSTAIADQAQRLLAEFGPMTVTQIVERMNENMDAIDLKKGKGAKVNSVRKTLNRHVAGGGAKNALFTKSGDTYTARGWEPPQPAPEPEPLPEPQQLFPEGQETDQ